MITGLYAAILVILLLALTYKVILMRFKLRIALGDGSNSIMMQNVRAHANFTEFVPIALIVMALAEIGGAPAFLVHGVGSLLVLGRVLHAWGLLISPEATKQRFIGTIMTHISMIIAALLCLNSYIFTVS